MATLTVQVPEKAGSALAALEGVSVDEYTLVTIIRDVLYEIQDEVHRIADDAAAPNADEVRALGNRFAGCAAALEGVQS